MKEEERKKERKKEENRILSRLEREATKNIGRSSKHCNFTILVGV